MKIGMTKQDATHVNHRERPSRAMRAASALALAIAGQLGGAHAALAALDAMPRAATSAAASGASAPAAAPLPDGIVARVNGVAITRDQLEQARVAASQPDTASVRAALKNELIARELLRQAAASAHYDTRPQVLAAVEQAKSLAMTQVWLQDHVKPEPVTDAEVKAKYDEVVAGLGQTELKPRVIVLKDRASADAALAQLKRGADFAQLARQAADGPSAAQGGALNWVSFRQPVPPAGQQGWPQPLAEALLKLPVGGVTSAPVEAGGRFWILRVDEQRPTRVPAYADAKDVLRRGLEQAALQKATIEMMVGLLKQAQIQQ
ncbi:peptidylprolyl isomerase [Burkholderia plantarii]|uniref:peptidylprolyl isomerase n=1 Tax=Burkholderia plantarii TaxID=41899 RepID=UPI0006D8A22D|nr:peptidylprolyl isomerase [Burkholderia plantarii]ALK33182.1 Putative PpiC-type peptidyl-prolyl cis-trans isomerase [Burkholderia plantarii]GLZ23170.1 peptidylprolyl isomerase [Burkholderia plantarii]